MGGLCYIKISYVCIYNLHNTYVHPSYTTYLDHNTIGLYNNKGSGTCSGTFVMRSYFASFLIDQKVPIDPKVYVTKPVCL